MSRLAVLTSLRLRAARIAAAALLSLSGPLVLSGCAQTSHPATPAGQGVPRTLADVEARLAAPGPVRFTKVTAADWEVPLEGLLNLHHPHAERAGLEDRPEPIQIYFYLLEHPTRGDYLVDTGVARSVARRSDDMPVSWIVRQAMNMDTLRVHVDTATWLAQRARPISGVFLTHLHLDHILGLQDIPRTTPVYVGPGEGDTSGFLNLFSRGTTNDNLEGFGPLREWPVQPRADGQLAVLDVFGDDSVYAIHIPGHTDGSVAYLVRSTEGPQLLTGDGCHTAWGWEHGVEPGTFNADPARAAESFTKLQAFAARHPELRVHLGHQSLPHDAQGAHPQERATQPAHPAEHARR